MHVCVLCVCGVYVVCKRVCVVHVHVCAPLGRRRGCCPRSRQARLSLWTSGFGDPGLHRALFRGPPQGSQVSDQIDHGLQPPGLCSRDNSGNASPPGTHVCAVCWPCAALRLAAARSPERPEQEGWAVTHTSGVMGRAACQHAQGGGIEAALVSSTSQGLSRLAEVSWRWPPRAPLLRRAAPAARSPSEGGGVRGGSTGMHVRVPAAACVISGVFPFVIRDKY